MDAKFFLCGRTQQVCVQNTLSSKGLITVGVPKGCILGPLLFSIYTNDLPSSVSICDINMYADDAELHYCHNQLQRVEQVLQNELQQVGGKSLSLSVNGHVLQQVSSTKYLGLYKDKHLQ